MVQINNVEVKQPTFSYTQVGIDWAKDKTKEFFKLIRDSFRWIGHFFSSIGHDATVAFNMGDRMNAGISLFGFKSLLVDVDDLYKAKNNLDRTESTGLAAIHGSGALKVLHQTNVIDLGAGADYLGPAANVGTVVASGISVYKANNDITASENGRKNLQGKEVECLDIYQKSKYASIAQQVAVFGIGAFGIAAAVVAFEVASITILALSTVAIASGFAKYSYEKFGEYTWKQLRFEEPSSQFLENPRYQPKSWKSAIA